MAWTESRLIEGRRMYRGRYSVKIEGKLTKPSTDWFRSDTEALGAANRLQAGRELEPASSSDRGPTVGEYAREWLPRAQANVESKATRLSYRNRVASILDRQWFAKKLIKEIVWQDVEDWILDLDGAASTKNHCLTIFGMVYRDAFYHGLIRDLLPLKTPGRKHKIYKGRVRRRVVLDRDDEVALLDAVQAPDIKLMIMIALDAGLRFGELAGLTVESFANPGYLEVLEAVSARELGRPKGVGASGQDEEPRQIPLSPRLEEALALPIARARKERGRRGLIFTAARGEGPTRYDRWSDHLEAAAIVALGPDGGELTGHQLRRTFASRLEANGVKPKQIKYLLGHSSLNVTEKYLTLGRQDYENIRRAIAG